MEDPIVNPVPVIEEQPIAEEVTEAIKPGEKTDSALLLESLKEERQKRREAEARAEAKELELLNLKVVNDTEVFSDEGKVLLTKIAQLQNQLASKEEKEVLTSIHSKFPQIKDKQEEFEQFQKDNPGMRLETQAKAFMIENDLLVTPAPRKGLEPNSGGGRIPVKAGLSADEVTNLRLNNPRKFRDMLKSGEIKS